MLNKGRKIDVKEILTPTLKAPPQPAGLPGQDYTGLDQVNIEPTYAIPVDAA
jgi:hypothetical protein